MRGTNMSQEIERRLDLAGEVLGLKVEIAAIHRENQTRHETHLREKVAQDKMITDLSEDIKELLALANKSKGGFWAGMAIASFAGGVITWVTTHISIPGLK